MKQIVYNYLDINGLGAVINNPLNCEIFKYGSNNTITQSIGTGRYISKLGVQAPPGTIFYLGIDADSREQDLSATANYPNVVTITVGRNGIYELEDSDVRIYAIQFKKPTEDDGKDEEVQIEQEKFWKNFTNSFEDFEKDTASFKAKIVDNKNIKEEDINKYIQILINFIVVNKSLLTDYQGILNQLFKVKESNSTRNIIVDYMVEGSV